MLILVRKVQQGIWIEGDIWVKVLSVDRDRVKLGITAPGSVKVMRQELCVDIENAGEKTNGHAERATPEFDVGVEEPS
jgi:carbon storage regulator